MPHSDCIDKKFNPDDWETVECGGCAPPVLVRRHQAAVRAVEPRMDWYWPFMTEIREKGPLRSAKGASPCGVGAGRF
jgi:hypothetical protein